jgi:hypothetical protein
VNFEPRALGTFGVESPAISLDSNFAGIPIAKVQTNKRGQSCGEKRSFLSEHPM